MPVETNIVIYTLSPGNNAKAHVAALHQHGIIAFAIAPEQVRLVFHLDVDDDGTQRTMEALKRTLA
jgi:threonine aldolase